MKVGPFLAWLLLKALHTAVSLLPFPVLLAVSRAAGTACYALGIRRRVVTENLRAAFGKELPEPELDRMGKRCYAEYGRIFSEIVKSDRLLRKREEHFDVQGLPTLVEAVNSGMGLLILSGHIGNFVVLGHFLRSMGFPMTFVARRVANEYVNREIEKVYGRHGSTIIPVRGFKNDPQGGIRLFRSLKRGDIVVALVDQDAGPDGYMSTFFGLPTSIPAGPARYAYRSRTPVTTAFATREGGRLCLEILPPIDYSGAGSPEAAERILLDEYSRRLEEKVRKAPEQYFWFHKKWKTLPEMRARYGGAG